MNQAIIVRTDGSIETLDHKPTLREAQEIVGECIATTKIQGTKDTLIRGNKGLSELNSMNRGTQEMYNLEIVGDVIILKEWKNLK